VRLALRQELAGPDRGVLEGGVLKIFDLDGNLAAITIVRFAREVGVSGGGKIRIHVRKRDKGDAFQDRAIGLGNLLRQRENMVDRVARGAPGGESA